jgi:hypothetical protein
MPLTTPLSSMTYATTSLQRSNLTVWLEITTGFDDVAEVRGHDTVVPHLAGRIARNRKKDVRGIELTGWVQGTGSTEAARLSSYRDLVDELQTLFDPVRVPAALAGTAWDGTTRSIVSRPIGLRWGDLSIHGLRPLVVILEAVTPDWS